ncbi:hypothetical protein AAH979_36225 [Plantactinospora sp. ZYX-F-223]|uniref:hypothetical protein n=1 Tax=Plantactinospora sp. ZYX-F-223 TaxID=3144103 RepID=UPI0031FE18D1
MLVAGALLLGAAPASAEPVAGATATQQAPTMLRPVCIGQEMSLSWTAVPGAFGYRIFADGVWVSGTRSTIDVFYGWDPDIIWSVRAIDQSGNYISPMSNSVRGGCQGAG